MAIGETFLSAFLQVLFEQLLTTGGSQFLKLIGGVDLPKTIRKWKIQLTRLEALLDDAELQQFHSKPVKLWLNDLQDLAYDIEDVLDHFAIEAQLYKKAEEDQVNAVDDHSIAGILNNMVPDLQMQLFAHVMVLRTQEAKKPNSSNNIYHFKGMKGNGVDFCILIVDGYRH